MWVLKKSTGIDYDVWFHNKWWLWGLWGYDLLLCLPFSKVLGIWCDFFFISVFFFFFWGGGTEQNCSLLTLFGWDDMSSVPMLNASLLICLSSVVLACACVFFFPPVSVNNISLLFSFPLSVFTISLCGFLSSCQCSQYLFVVFFPPVSVNNISLLFSFLLSVLTISLCCFLSSCQC